MPYYILAQFEMMQDDLQEKMDHHIQTLYNFKHVIWRDKVGGLSNINYEISADSHSYILKKYNSKNKFYIQRMERVIGVLAAQNVPVPLSLFTQEGRQNFEYEGDFFTLYPKIPGDVLHEPLLYGQVLQTIASFLVKIHRIDPASLDLKRVDARLFSTPLVEDRAREMRMCIQKKSLGHFIDTLTQECIRVKLEALKRTASIYRDCSGSRYHSNFVHGDFHNENILFNTSRQIVGLLDFEEVHQGHRIEDVVHFVFLGCCNTGFASPNMRKARQFMQAYHAIFPLDPEEIAWGVRHAMRREYSSLFLEWKLYETRDLFFTHLLERDLKKIDYLQKNEKQFIDNLIP